MIFLMKRTSSLKRILLIFHKSHHLQFFLVIALSEKPQGRHVFTELELESNILGIRDLADIQCGIRENAEFLDGIRELTTTWATGFAEISERDVVLGKKRYSGQR